MPSSTNSWALPLPRRATANLGNHRGIDDEPMASCCQQFGKNRAVSWRPPRPSEPGWPQVPGGGSRIQGELSEDEEEPLSTGVGLAGREPGEALEWITGTRSLFKEKR